MSETLMITLIRWKMRIRIPKQNGKRAVVTMPPMAQSVSFEFDTGLPFLFDSSHDLLFDDLQHLPKTFFLTILPSPL